MSLRFPDALLFVLAVIASPLAGGAASAPAATSAPTLRVCAHPANLPFSAQDRSGFDNRIARLLADELGMQLAFTWLEPQHGLVRKTIGAGLCDVIMGLPQGYEGVAATAPYYRSRYVFVYPQGEAQPPSFADSGLVERRIGVQLIGDDMAATPPGHALARAHARHVIGFPVYGEQPAVARMVDAIAHHDLDAGVAWGPAAGYFAARAPTPLAIAPAVAPPGFPMPFEFAVVIGVAKGNQTMKQALDRALVARRAEIDAVLAEYHVPRTDRTEASPGGLASCTVAAVC
jgi:quinoprotein dehydrogenase-associated probable ABC transporter substrate-binding protein